MPRKKLIRQNQFPYHVCSRSNNRDWYSIPMNQVWKIALESLCYAHKRFTVDVHAFVLMNNHYHLMLTTPNSNIDQFMQAFNKSFSEKLKKESGRINRMFGGPYRWSMVQNENYLQNLLRYLYQNPLRAGIAIRCELYPYSTLHYLAKNKSFPVPLAPIGPEISREVLDWYNLQPGLKEDEKIRKGLRRTIFLNQNQKNPESAKPCDNSPHSPLRPLGKQTP